MSPRFLESSVTFFYTYDFELSAWFYEDGLGLELCLAQGSWLTLVVFM